MSPPVLAVRRAVAAVLPLALVACAGTARREPPSQLRDALIERAGPGFDVVEGASGPMPLDLAARATPNRAGELRRFLRHNGFQEGWSRVWRGGDEFVTALVFDFFDAEDARALVELTFAGLGTSRAFVPFDDAGIPGSRGYRLTSHVDGKVRFCAGEWFTVADRTYAVTRCAPHPLGGETVRPLAREQYERALRGDRP